MECPCSRWTLHTVERSWAWYAIITLGHHTRLDYVTCGIPSSLLERTHDRMKPSLACPCSPWTTHTVGRRWAWHAIIALGLHRVGQRLVLNAIIEVGKHIWSDDRGSRLPLRTFDITHGKMMSDMACNHRPWTAHTKGRCRSWDAIIALVLPTQMDDVGRGMPSSP